MNFIRYPAGAFAAELTHADRTVFLFLLSKHFSFCRSDYESSFYITDRDLATVSNCSLYTVWKAKHRLRDSGLIEFFRGEKNKTYYKIIP